MHGVGAASGRGLRPGFPGDGRRPRMDSAPRSCNLLAMNASPPDEPRRPRGQAPEGAPREGAPAVEGDAPLLADLLRQWEALRRDVRRIEATLAQEPEIDAGLYERLLRCRRISGKPENRISVVHLEQRRRIGT